MSATRWTLRSFVLAGLAVGIVAPVTVAHADPSPAEVQQQLTKSQTAFERVVEQYNKINEQLKANRRKTAALTAELQPLQKQLDQAHADIGQMVSTAYKSGTVSEATALLTSGSPSVLMERMTTLDILARDRQQKVDTYGAQKQSYDLRKRALDSLVVDQAAQVKELAAKKSKIEADISRLKQLRSRVEAAAASRAASRSGSTSATPPAVSGAAGIAVRYAYGALGKPYVWAADGPNGYDCSGLTLAAWRAAGKTLPHNAAMQWGVVSHISRSQLQPGDLVFYESLGHVALYVGSGKVIHAPTYGDVVKISSIDMMPPYGYGRVT